MYQSRRFILDKDIRLIFAMLELNEAQVLRKAKLPLDFFDRKTISLSTAEYYDFWTAIFEAAETDAPLPLMFEKVQVQVFAGVSPPIMAALCSPDFVTFTNRIQKFKPLIGPLVLEIDSDDQFFSISVTSIDPAMKLHPIIIASETIFFVSMIRECTREHVVPVRVETKDPMDNVKAYQQFFGIKPVVGEKDQIVFKMEDAKLPFRMKNEAVWKYFEPVLQKRLDELEKDSTFSAQVRAALAELLPLGQSSIEDVAEKLYISTRTLQRRLKNEKTNYQQQLNHSRELLARHYLTTSEMNIAEISFLLGYEEPSSLSRAFHVWTGQSPESFRRMAS